MQCIYIIWNLTNQQFAISLGVDLKLGYMPRDQFDFVKIMFHDFQTSPLV